MFELTRRTALLGTAAMGSTLAFGSQSANAERSQPPSIPPLAPESASYSRNRSLDYVARQRRQRLIDAQAISGLPLSPDDAEFIRTQVYLRDNTVVAYAATKTQNINRTGSGAGGSGTIKGFHQFTYSDNPLNTRGAWSAHWVAQGSSTVRKIVASEHIRVYGLLGKSGVGIVYRADPSSTINGRQNAFNRTESFRAYGGYISAHYQAIFYTKTGSFEIYG